MKNDKISVLYTVWILLEAFQKVKFKFVSKKLVTIIPGSGSEVT
jgi:hypothetical protein